MVAGLAEVCSRVPMCLRGQEFVVYRALIPTDVTLTFWAVPERCQSVARRDLSSAAVPSVMRKVIAHALKEN